MIAQARPGTLLIAPYTDFTTRFETMGCTRIEGFLYMHPPAKIAGRDSEARHACRLRTARAPEKWLCRGWVSRRAAPCPAPLGAWRLVGRRTLWVRIQPLVIGVPVGNIGVILRPPRLDPAVHQPLPQRRHHRCHRHHRIAVGQLRGLIRRCRFAARETADPACNDGRNGAAN